MPLHKGKHSQVSCAELKIYDLEDWRRSQLESIRAAYSSSPYFLYYQHDISNLITQQTDSVCKLNMEILEWINDKFFEKRWTIKRIVDYHEEHLVDHDLRFLHLLTNRMEWGGLQPYAQVFEGRHGYEANLSCLDLIFNLGPGLSSHLGPGLSSHLGFSS